MSIIREIEIFAAKIRLETIRQIGARGFGHVSGSLSVADLLAVLYHPSHGVLRIDPKNPDLKSRDFFVMSKGHAGPALYSALALRNFYPMEWLKTLNQPGTRLPSHCDRLLTPGVDMTTGSLGQGVSSAIGLCLSQRMDGTDARTYLVIGDGECNEGQVWEGVMFAHQQKLENLVAFVDYNKKQLDGTTQEIMDLGDIAAKFAAFGWHAQTINGGSCAEISQAIATAHNAKGAPSCIVMNTIKGAHVPSIYAIEQNHHIVLEGALLEQAILECEQTLETLEA